MIEYLAPEYCLDWPAPDDGWEPPVEPGATVDVRSLVLAGEQDLSVPTHVSRKLLELFPDAIWAPIANAGHSVHGWAPCQRDLIAEFVDTLDDDGEMCAPDSP